MFKVGDIYNHADMLKAAQEVYGRYGDEIEASYDENGDGRRYISPVL